ncbi:hypothetical protein LTR37_019569 [Vermiconidia calcicola]|uniref:Uncharacterized protein n=1 Tax=Vermiconidia calcicola TaxID=1690605 RepID=A0ACC3MF16_9PEZI|nr:hypothetical protein LTR37_019569 [Vermiconidia calcicola]
MHPGFAQKIDNQTGQWGYNFGPVSSDEYTSRFTFRQYGDPFTYDVRPFTSELLAAISALDIRPELNTKSEPYSITLMFINSCRIYYKEDSDDRIFPADRRWARNPELWTNNDSRARPLACIDWTEVCTHQGTCVPPYQDDQDGDEHYMFTRFALNKSTAFHAIEFRGAAGLDAQYKIRGDTSLPLSRDPPQWITESWGLFNALALAGPIPAGWDNIRIWPTIGLLAIPLIFWLMGIETGEEFSEEKKKTGYFRGNKLLGIEWVIWQLSTYIAEFWHRQLDGTDQGSHDASTQGQAGGDNQHPAHPANYGSTSATSQLHLSNVPALSTEP